MAFNFEITALPPPPTQRPRWLIPVSLGMLVVLISSSLALIAVQRGHSQPFTGPTVAYRVLSTVNYGTLSIDGHPTPWLTTPIHLTIGTHILTLVAPPLAVACIVTLPKAAANDTCQPGSDSHTLVVAPRVVDLAPRDRDSLEGHLVPTTGFPIAVPKGGLVRAGATMWDLLPVTPAPAAFIGDAFGAMPDYRYNIHYQVPGEADELQHKNASDGYHFTCTTYPICDAAPRLPDTTVPPALWISIPWLTGYDFTTSNVYRNLDYGERRIDVPVRATATLEYGTPTRQWTIDPATLHLLISNQLCDFERGSFVAYVKRHHQQTITLTPVTGCQATIMPTGGRIAISSGVVFLDAIAHQDYPEFPTFAQQIQGGA